MYELGWFCVGLVAGLALAFGNDMIWAKLAKQARKDRDQ